MTAMASQTLVPSWSTAGRRGHERQELEAVHLFGADAQFRKKARSSAGWTWPPASGQRSRPAPAVTDEANR